MATEELIVLLDAQTQKLDAKLRATEKRLDDFEGSTDKADKSLVKMSEAGKKAGAVALKLGVAVLAVSGAIEAMVLASANNRKELELLSKQAKTTTADFQALAFSTMQYGVNGEQIADISKDISDKVAEFSIAGTGAFQDYADSIKLTKEEAREAAKEFTTMSSQEVIGKMISEMEQAGLSASDMTFALESMGSDLSKLQPLFAGNSAELDKLKKRFKSVNEELQITDIQAEKLKEVSTSYQLMTTQIGSAATAISGTLAPVMDDFFNDVISVVPDATQTIIDFVNSFLDAKNITTISAIDKQIADSQLRALEYQSEINEFRKAQNSYAKDGGELNTRAIRQLEEAIQSERLRTEELNLQLEVIKEQSLALEDSKRLKGGEIGGEGGEIGGEAGEIGGEAGSSSGGSGTGEQIEAIENRFRSEEDLLVAKLERELEIIGGNDELKSKLENEFYEKALERQLDFEAERGKIDEDAISKKAKLDSKAGKAKISLEDNIAKNSMNLLNMVAGENKAAAIAGLLIQKASALSANATATLSGSMLAYASQLIPGDPTSVLRAEVARDATLSLGSLNAGLIVATGLGEAAGILGGGGDGGASSGNVGGAPQEQQQNFQEDSSRLELTDSSDSGSQSFNIIVPDGDEIGEAIANWLNKAKAEGRT